MDQPDEEKVVVDYGGRYWAICVALECARFGIWVVLVLYRK